MEKKIFSIEESPYYPGKYMIRVDYESFNTKHTEGSFNVLCARLFDLPYPAYLRMCRDCFGAEIIGKGKMYPVAYFKRSDELTTLVKLLNARANAVLWDKDHPDYKEHEAFIKANEPSFYEKVKNGKSNS